MLVSHAIHSEHADGQTDRISLGQQFRLTVDYRMSTLLIIASMVSGVDDRGPI
jgi:hypothetical protein